MDNLENINIEFNSHNKSEKPLYCDMLWNNLQFDPLGRIYPCCLSDLYKDVRVTDKFIDDLDLFDKLVNNYKSIALRQNILTPFCLIQHLARDCYQHVRCGYYFNNYKEWKHIFDEYKHTYKKNTVLPDDIKMITVDFSTHCQLKCPGCWRILTPKYTELAYTTPIILKKLVKLFPKLERISISSNGESLLNPDFCKLINICNFKKLEIQNNSGVNLNRITDEQIYSIVNSNFTTFIVSIDGASNETYSKYRIGGNFDKVIENIKRINYFKNLYNNRSPKLCWKYILFDFNLHEVDIAAKMAEDLGMEFSVAENIYKTLPSINYIETRGDEVLEYIKKYEYSSM